MSLRKSFRNGVCRLLVVRALHTYVVIDHLLTVLSEPGSAQRSMFTYANAPPVPGPTATLSSSNPNTTTTTVNAVPPQVSELTEPTSTSRIHPTGSAVNSTPAHPPFQPFLSARSPTLITPSVLDSDPAATRHQIAVLGSHLDTSSIAPQSVGVISPTTPGLTQVITPRQVIDVNRTAGPDPPSDLTGGTGNAGTMVTGRSIYKIRDQTNTTPGRTRRDSIEGAPDIVLTLSGSGYGPSDEPGSSAEPTPATPSTIIPSDTSTTVPEDSIVPSSQQSLEEVLTIPAETDVSFPNKSSAGGAALPLSLPPPEGSSIIANRRGNSRFAPRTIPDYQIDRSDLPSWFHQSERLDAVLNVEVGGLWEKLINLWLQQERRLKFGLDATIVSSTFYNPCFISQ